MLSKKDLVNTLYSTVILSSNSTSLSVHTYSTNPHACLFLFQNFFEHVGVLSALHILYTALNIISEMFGASRAFKNIAQILRLIYQQVKHSLIYSASVTVLSCSAFANKQTHTQNTPKMQNLELTVLTSKQTWWPWIDLLYMEAQESILSTTAPKKSIA